MNRIPQLPKWCLTNIFPAFHDYESLSAIDQTARLYGAMQGLIDDYNKFANELNSTIENFVNDLNADQECFKNEITKIVHDYIAMLDEKLKQQDKEIEESIVYIKENLSVSIEQTLNEMKENGELSEVIGDALNEITTRLSTLEETVTAHTNTLEGLKTDNTSNKNRIASLETGYSNNKTNIESVTERVGTLETGSESLSGRVGTLETGSESLSGRVGTLETGSETLEGRVNLIESDITIMIGDSYAVGITNNTDGTASNIIPSWCDYLKNHLKLTDENYYKFAEGSSGFTKQGSGGHTFKTLLSSNISSISNVNNVKRIIVCGGHNDINSTESVIEDAIEDFMNYCKTNFPNATVYIGMIGYNTQINQSGYDTRRLLFFNSLIGYSRCCQYGGVYLSGVENILKHDSLMSEDFGHPNETGYIALGQGIFNAIYNKATTLYGVSEGTIINTENYDLSNSSEVFNANNVRSHIVDELNCIYTDRITMKFNNVITFDTQLEFTVGQLNLKTYKPTIGNSLRCACIISLKDSSNNLYSFNGIVRVDVLGKLNISIFAVNGEDDYKVINNVNTVVIQPLEFIIPTKIS